jgi:threonine dehydrogenase-like Zn-dependent dehydrogenase
LRPLLERIEKGELDPSFIVTHRMSLEEAPRAFQIFRDKREECVKVVLKPDGMSRAASPEISSGRPSAIH